MSKKKQKQQPNAQTSSQSDPYDVKKSLRKLRSSSPVEVITKSHPEASFYGSNATSSSHVPSLNQTSTTGTFDKFDRLDDKLSSEVSTLRSEINQNRDRLSDKLDNKVDSGTFYWVVGGLLAIVVAIGGGFYALSYSGIVEKVEKCYSSIIADEGAEKAEKELLEKKPSKR